MNGFILKLNGEVFAGAMDGRAVRPLPEQGGQL